MEISGTFEMNGNVVKVTIEFPNIDDRLIPADYMANLADMLKEVFQPTADHSATIWLLWLDCRRP